MPAPVVRKLLIWAVLLLTPFTGVRVVCIDAPADVAETRVTASPDCDEVCARPLKPQAKRGGFNCALKADACNQLLASTVAVVPASDAPVLQLVPTHVVSVAGPQYAAPALFPDSPPPKA